MALFTSVAAEVDGLPSVLICGTDMTHQSEIQAQLRESEQHFRRLFENMRDVYYRTNAQGVVLHSLGDNDFLEKASRVALVPGMDWSEQTKGTNAIGTALIEQARDAADELLQRDTAAAEAHLERWLGGKSEFIKA